MVMFDMEIDYLVLNPQKVIRNGIIRPPPPIPPTLAIPSKRGRTMVPINSIH